MSEYDFETFEEFMDEWPCDTLNFCVGVAKPERYSPCWVFNIAQPRKDRMQTISVHKATKGEVQKYINKSKAIISKELDL